LEIRLGIQTTYLYTVPKVFLLKKKKYSFSAFSSFLRRFFIRQFNISCLRKHYYGKQLERRVPFNLTKNLSFDLPVSLKFVNFTQNHVLVRSNRVTQAYMFRIPKVETGKNKKEETVGIKIVPTAPYDILVYQGSNQHTSIYQTPLVYEDEWVAKGDVLTDTSASVAGELAVGKSILVAYMPWEGYNFEDAILINERLIYNDVYTSIHIENYKTYFGDTLIGPHVLTSDPVDSTAKQRKLLAKNGIVKIGSWVTPNDILVGRLVVDEYRVPNNYEVFVMQVLSTKLFPPIGRKKKIDRKKKIRIYKDACLRIPRYVFGRVVHTEVVFSDQPIINFIPYPIEFHVHVYVAAKKTIEIGDKMSGRHGNKGIISNILPRQDMPYLPDGTPVDMVLNPLGVPSRMNVGQIFESLLGLAAKELNQHFRINCFDEIAGPEASRTLTYSKLFEARLKTGKQWLFNGNFPGKMNLFDGRTGESFHQTITVGQSYMLKLNHMVQDKIHARGVGPYATVTQQPLKGRKNQGGQRVGEMEVWALEGFGAAYTLQEILTAKSDDMNARNTVEQTALTKTEIALGTPESFKVLISELQCLCVNVGIYSINAFGFRDRVDIMRISDQIFQKRETGSPKAVEDQKSQSYQDNLKAVEDRKSQSYQNKRVKILSLK